MNDKEIRRSAGKVTPEVVGIRAVRVINMAVDFIVLTILVLLLFFGTYAIWDAKQIYSQAEAQQYEQYKPVSDDTLSFDELKGINSEVFAWLNVYGTGIDYPVAQASENQKYINTNIQGEHSLAGSIYMDYRNSKDFSDFNSIIYGHHMEESSMFGDLDKFMDEAFFESHQYGNLYYDGEDHGLEFFAYLLADAYDWTLYNPAISSSSAAQTDYLDYIQSIAEYTRDIGVSSDDRIVLLSTCAAEPTNGRHILVGRLTDEVFTDEFTKETNDGFWSRVDTQALKSWAERMPMLGWIGILFLIILILIILILVESLHNKKKVQQKNEEDIEQ